jgi:hypothetical protein
MVSQKSKCLPINQNLKNVLRKKMILLQLLQFPFMIMKNLKVKREILQQKTLVRFNNYQLNSLMMMIRNKSKIFQMMSSKVKALVTVP